MRRIILATTVSIALVIGASTAALVARGGGGSPTPPVAAALPHATASHPADIALPQATDMSQWRPYPPTSQWNTFPSAGPAPLSAVATAPGTTLLVSPRPGAAYITYLLDPSKPSVIGELSATTWGGPTARPVIATMGDLLQIRLDNRPNGSTAWVHKADVTTSTTPYRIVISVSQRTLTLLQNGSAVYSAPVGVGRPQWATPTGPSFVDAKVQTPPSLLHVYGPLVVITGTHSNVFTEFDGGDGTVGIHGYPSNPASTMGVASSHGCIRTSPTTISVISVVPVGTPIDITG